MKRKILFLTVIAVPLLALTACEGLYDYFVPEETSTQEQN